MSGTQNWTTWGYRLLLAACVLLGAMALTPQHAAAQGLGAGIAQQTLSQIPGATAQTASTSDGAGTVEKILTAFYNSTKTWQGALSGFAKNLFWILVGIEVSWMAISLAIKGADLGEWLQEIVSQVFFIGFFAFLLFQAAEILPAIVHSFTGAGEQVANKAGVSLSGTSANMKTLGGIDPVQIFRTGTDLSWKIWKAGTETSFVFIIICGFAAVIIAIMFGFITAMIIVTLVESYVYMSASVFFLGFGGSRWTKDYASKMLNLAVSVGAKLFMMQLLIVLAYGVITSLSASIETSATGCSYTKEGTSVYFNVTDPNTEKMLAERGLQKVGGNCPSSLMKQVFMLIAVVFVIFLLVKSIPNMIQGVLSGAGGGAGGAEAYIAGKMPDPLNAAMWVTGTAYAPVAAMAMGGRIGWNQKTLEGRGFLSKLGGALGGAIANPLKEAVKMQGDRMAGRRRYGPRAGLLRHIPHGLKKRLEDQKTQFETGKPGTSRDSGKVF